MGLLRRMAVRLAGNHDIDDGARELAAEYVAMLAQAGIAARPREVEDEDGMAFISVEDVYGDTLAAVQGTPGKRGYLVAAAPFVEGVDSFLATWPGKASFAGRGVLEETLSILAAAGLIEPQPGVPDLEEYLARALEEQDPA